MRWSGPYQHGRGLLTQREADIGTPLRSWPYQHGHGLLTQHEAHIGAAPRSFNLQETPWEENELHPIRKSSTQNPNTMHAVLVEALCAGRGSAPVRLHRRRRLDQDEEA